MIYAKNLPAQEGKEALADFPPPVRRTDAQCTSRSGVDNYPCTIGEGHEGVHVCHDYYAEDASANSDYQRIVAYWVRGD